MTARVAVLVSGGGSNLQALLDAQQAGALKSGRIALVVSSRGDAFALTRAQSAGVPTAVCARSGASQETFEAALHAQLAQHEIDIVVLAGFMHILSAAFVARYAGRMLNVHPSLIPSFCGAGFYGLKVHEAALAAGVKLTGATVHLVNEIPDGGEILLQKAVPVRKNDTPETLQQRVMRQAEWRLLPRAAELVCRRFVAARRSAGAGTAPATK